MTERFERLREALKNHIDSQILLGDLESIKNHMLFNSDWHEKIANANYVLEKRVKYLTESNTKLCSQVAELTAKCRFPL